MGKVRQSLFYSESLMQQEGSMDKQDTQECRDTKECLECSGAGGVLIEAMCFCYCSARFYGYKVSFYMRVEKGV